MSIPKTSFWIRRIKAKAVPIAWGKLANITNWSKSSIKGRRNALSPALREAIRAHGAALLRRARCDQYAPLLLDLWEGDVIGPLACWLWFEVERLPIDTWIAIGLYADRALDNRIKEGIEAGPSFRNKAHLRGALMALYDYIEGAHRREPASMGRTGHDC